jgi:rod shape-determining protein MreB
VISLGGIVSSNSVKCAGNKIDAAIIDYVKKSRNLAIGEKTAEEIKIKIGAISNHEQLESEVRGRDIITGLPRQILVNNHDIREAITHSISILVEGVKEVLEKTPPEVVSDVMQKGIHLVGGGAMIGGLNELLQDELDIAVYIGEDPLYSVVVGTGLVLDRIDDYQQVLIHEDDELPLR